MAYDNNNTKPRDSVKALLDRRERAVSKKINWRDLMDAAYKYSLPNRNPYLMTQPGTNMNWDVYDGTLVLGLRKFVNRMINALVPPDVNWVNMVAGRMIPEDQQEDANMVLQKITDTFFFYLRQSNFNLTIHEAFTDMAISTGVLQINEGPEDSPIVFSCIPSDAVAFSSGPRGDIDAFFRDWFNMTPEYCEQLWGEKFTIPQCFEGKREEEIKMDLYEISYYCHEEKLYKTCIIEKSSSERCYEKKEESWEWIGFRWSRLASEDAGRGPVLDALPTAMTINKCMEDELKVAALAAGVPLMAYTDSIINPYTFNVEPNSIIPVRQNSSGVWPIQPLPVGGDINFISIVVNDLRSQINEIMMSQPMQPLQNDKVRTATEVTIIQNELRENAGAQFSRVQKELFDPLVRRVLWILKKKGLIEPVIIDGKEVALSYITPLSISKDQNDLKKMMDFFQIIAGMFTPAGAISMIDAPKMPRWVGEKLGADLELIRSEIEIKEIIKKGQEMAEQAMEQQQPGPPQAGPPPGQMQQQPM